jgi:ABC-type antimicrobial peptide transport system permease subunit
MFDFPLVYGNRETALNEPYALILTEKAAIRLFGSDDPMGQTVMINNQHSMTVTGVMKDLPVNTFFQFEALTSIDFLKTIGRYDDAWLTGSLRTFVELQPKALINNVNESIRDIIKRHTNEDTQHEAYLFPLSKKHLYSEFENGMPVKGKLVEKMGLYGVIAGLILLIACINCINLSTARSVKRAKEVGVRKVLGGKRWALIQLFLSESMIVSFIAGMIALCLAVLALPAFSQLMDRQLTLNFTTGGFWMAGLGFVLLTGLLAGSYPAFYLSSFLPVKVLKNIFTTKQAWFSPRKVLVVAQFAVACVLIMSTLVIHRQIMHARNRDSGYDKNQLMYTSLSGDINKNYDLIKHNLLTSGTAISVTRSSNPMTGGRSDLTDVEWKGKDPTKPIVFDGYNIDADWTKTVGATIIEGREIDNFAYLSDSTAIMLNETAVKTMNLEHPIGEIIKINGADWHVVGIVKDFIRLSPYEPVEPMLIGGAARGFYTMNIKLNSANRIADNLAQAEQIFKQFNPANPFEYQFVDEDYARKFQNEQKTGLLATYCAGLTIFISCLGLFALVAYMAETRRKEIGIRKVLGASVGSVMYLLTKEFLILVVISFAVASPIAWWVMNQWLAGYAYRTNMPWWLFVAVGGISVGIALLTVGFQAFKAATANPVKAIMSSE